MPVSLSKLYEGIELVELIGVSWPSLLTYIISAPYFSPMFKRTCKSSIFMTGSLRYSVTTVDRLDSISTTEDELQVVIFRKNESFLLRGWVTCVCNTKLLE